MARATQTIKKTTIKSKSSSTGDRMKCNICSGTGYQKKPASKKK